MRQAFKDFPSCGDQGTFSDIQLCSSDAVGSLHKASCVTCFTPLWNSAEPVSRSKNSCMRNIWTLQWIHVIGSGMPTTEMAADCPSGFPGVPSAPDCELHSLRSWEANTNLRRLSLRPCAPGCPEKGRAARTHIPAHCRLPVWPFFQALRPGEHAARPPSSRHAARRGMRCIGPRKAATGAGTGGPSQRVATTVGLGNLTQLTPCCTHNPYRAGDVPTHGRCIQEQLENT